MSSGISVAAAAAAAAGRRALCQCSYNESGVLGPVTVHVDAIVHRDPARLGEVDAGQANAGHTHQLHLVGTHTHTGRDENTRQ